MTVNRCAGDLARVRRLGPSRLEAVVRRELPRWGETRQCLRIVRAVFAALGDGAGVIAHRLGALEPAGLAMADWHDTREWLASAANWLRLRLARLARDRLRCDQSGHPAGPLGCSQPTTIGIPLDPGHGTMRNPSPAS